MAILVQFLLRMSFGLAVGMAVTAPRLVSSGYYRNHLYVTLGMATLAALVASLFSTVVTVLAVAAALLSYVGSVCWLYEAKQAGIVLLWCVAGCSLAAALVGERSTIDTNEPSHASQIPTEIGIAPRAVAQRDANPAPGGESSYEDTALPFRELSVVTSGLLLGITFAAMLLGHWYLNSPGMELAPLRQLLRLMFAATVAQMIVSGLGLTNEVRFMGGDAHGGWWLFVVLRWSFGLVGVLALVVMAWQTLKIPNTQSATGILYVAVIGTIVGELMALLLSAESVYPL
jgi:hypothetical protein